MIAEHKAQIDKLWKKSGQQDAKSDKMGSRIKQLEEYKVHVDKELARLDKFRAEMRQFVDELSNQKIA